MKKRLFPLLAALWLPSVLWAQLSRDVFKADRELSASNYVAYRAPQEALTPAPKGYHPFYLSHYGRHGSRYLIGRSDYDRPYRTLLKADSLGKLTPRGRTLLAQVRAIRDEAMGRDGELTLRGADQHKGIARRMVERFPEVFAGPTHVDAKSTTVIRCILSMENALQQLLVMNPELDIRHDASVHDMWYMNQPDRRLDRMKNSPEAKAALREFNARHENYAHTMETIFNDTAYWRHDINAASLDHSLFKLASNMQSTDLRGSISLYDLFTDEEIYDNWLRDNAWWYVAYGPSPLSGGVQPFSQRNLLRMMIHEADSCLALPHPGATLRYGHDTMVMPLTCLLDLDGLGQPVQSLDSLDARGWRNYDIFPMACNIQMVFYRGDGKDGDILVKVLRNEREARLPLKSGMEPYYRWSDVRAFYLARLDGYAE